MPYRGAGKSLLQAAQKDPEAREKSTSGGVLRVRRSEAIERQRRIWVFFSSLLGIDCNVDHNLAQREPIIPAGCQINVIGHQHVLDEAKNRGLR